MTPRSVDTRQLHEWLDRARAGDRSAREELLRSVAVRMERLASKMLGRFPNVQRWAETCDVLQNALLRLLRALGEVRPDSMRAFFGLAAEQLRRELLDLTRHFTRANNTWVGGRAPDGDSQSPAPEAAATAEDPAELELWEHFHESVLLLPADDREVVNLLYYHGLTQPQAAEVLQVNERTVRRRWRAACIGLQQRLHGRFPGLDDAE
jgi:RNA polymerase sigma-70 factor (ECF subfamily)